MKLTILNSSLIKVKQKNNIAKPYEIVCFYSGLFFFQIVFSINFPDSILIVSLNINNQKHLYVYNYILTETVRLSHSYLNVYFFVA